MYSVDPLRRACEKPYASSQGIPKPKVWNPFFILAPSFEVTWRADEDAPVGIPTVSGGSRRCARVQPECHAAGHSPAAWAWTTFRAGAGDGFSPWPLQGQFAVVASVDL